MNNNKKKVSSLPCSNEIITAHIGQFGEVFWAEMFFDKDFVIVLLNQRKHYEYSYDIAILSIRIYVSHAICKIA